MNAVNRLLAVGILAVASVASLTEIWPQLGPQSDLWKVSGYLRQIDDLNAQSDQLDSQNALLRQLAVARTRVMKALREGRLTASQAVDRFVELDSIRTEAGLVNAPQYRGFTATELARVEVLGFLRHLQKTTPAAGDSQAFARALQELEGSMVNSAF